MLHKAMQDELVMKARHSQHGVALLMLVFFIALILTGYILKSLDSADIKNKKDKKTADALAQAKTALIAFAATRDLAPGICTTNCPRPGDLPCPDTNNDGNAEASCGSAAGSLQATRLGRLPWRTLGLPDLRDGDGERLWYAVSNRYKNNTRFRPLNSDTFATITLRSNTGNILFDGTADGIAAAVIAPGATIERQDAISQVRDGINQNIASNYLDVAFGEDNQNFVDGGLDGFIMGPVIDALGSIIVNDKILTVTRDEMNQAIEPRVLAEIRSSLVTYYAGAGATSYPYAANFNDITCLGNGDIDPNCLEGISTHGRIPANPINPWGASSILRGGNLSNWFQLNAWREVIHYAVAPACATGNVGCGGVGGLLTLNNAWVLPTNNKQVVLIASGTGLAGQVRTINADKSMESNFLEGGNLAPNPPDNVYLRTVPLNNLINDRAISIP